MSKRNVIFNRPVLSSEQIKSYRDFDKILSQSPATSAGGQWWLGGFIAVAMLILFSQSLEKPLPNKKSQGVLNTGSIEKSVQLDYMSGIDSTHFSIYEFQAEKGANIEHPSGSLINIPENAFILKDGTLALGEITLKYREFHDQLDIWMSRIPMNYDSAGHHLFESAGMIEIRAFQNGQELKLAPNKHINVDLISYNDDPSYNVYHLNKDKQWDYLGKDSIQPIILDKPMVDRGTDYPSDSALFEHMRCKPVPPNTYDDHAYTFDLDVNTKDFPYLSQFEHVIFEVANPNTFNPDIYNVEWEDARLNELTSGKLYTLKLIKGDRTEDIVVKPVLSGNDLKRALEIYHKDLNVWQQKRTLIEDELRDARTLYQSKLEQFEQVEQDYRNDQKMTLTRDVAMRKQHILLNMINSGKPRAYRGLNISILGVINCDKPREAYPKGKKKPAHFVDGKTGKFIIPAIVFLIEKGKNLIYRFSKEQYQQSFAYNTDATNTMWMVTKEGKLAVMRPEQFKFIDQEQDHYTLTMSVSDRLLTSKEDIALFLGLLSPSS